MDHDHASDMKEVSKKRLWIAFYLTLIYMFVEIVMGISRGNNKWNRDNAVESIHFRPHN